MPPPVKLSPVSGVSAPHAAQGIVPPPHVELAQSQETTPARPKAQLENWDNKRLQVNSRYASLLQAHGLTSCDAFFEYAGGEAVRHVGTRETRRLTLDGPDGLTTLYLKRHGAPPWRDRIMPWLHFARPIHGARNEWEAIGRFVAAGIPTMTPVAFGELRHRSFLVTEALPARCNLLEWVAHRIENGTRQAVPSSLHNLIARVAEITKRMHSAGLHHQDFYLNHLLLCDREGAPDVRVIDLGRVRQRKALARRWVIKDLAQLNFSASGIGCADRLRFLRLYLGRPFNSTDRRVIRQITLKSRRIASHTKKHRL